MPQQACGTITNNYEPTKTDFRYNQSFSWLLIILMEISACRIDYLKYSIFAASPETVLNCELARLVHKQFDLVRSDRSIGGRVRLVSFARSTGQHQQHQTVVFRVQQPGLGSKRFLVRRNLHRGALTSNCGAWRSGCPSIGYGRGRGRSCKVDALWSAGSAAQD